MSAVPFSPYGRLLVVLYTLLPVVVTLGFCPRPKPTCSLGFERGVSTVPPALLLADVAESAETGEAIEEEDAEPKRVARKERHTLFVANLPKGMSCNLYCREIDFSDAYNYL